MALSHHLRRAGTLILAQAEPLDACIKIIDIQQASPKWMLQLLVIYEFLRGYCVEELDFTTISGLDYTRGLRNLHFY